VPLQASGRMIDRSRTPRRARPSVLGCEGKAYFEVRKASATYLLGQHISAWMSPVGLPPFVSTQAKVCLAPTASSQVQHKLVSARCRSARSRPELVSNLPELCSYLSGSSALQYTRQPRRVRFISTTLCHEPCTTPAQLSTATRVSVPAPGRGVQSTGEMAAPQSSGSSGGDVEVKGAAVTMTDETSRSARGVPLDPDAGRSEAERAEIVGIFFYSTRA
jgi:hypothetical protein